MRETVSRWFFLGEELRVAPKMALWGGPALGRGGASGPPKSAAQSGRGGRGCWTLRTGADLCHAPAPRLPQASSPAGDVTIFVVTQPAAWAAGRPPGPCPRPLPGWPSTFSTALPHASPRASCVPAARGHLSPLLLSSPRCVPGDAESGATRNLPPAVCGSPWLSRRDLRWLSLPAGCVCCSEFWNFRTPLPSARGL